MERVRMRGGHLHLRDHARNSSHRNHRKLRNMRRGQLHAFRHRGLLLREPLPVEHWRHDPKHRYPHRRRLHRHLVQPLRMRRDRHLPSGGIPYPCHPNRGSDDCLRQRLHTSDIPAKHGQHDRPPHLGQRGERLRDLCFHRWHPHATGDRRARLRQQHSPT